MASKLDSFPFIRHATRYPWDEWFDGSTWEVTQGEDFICKPSSFRTAAFTAARKRNLTLHTRVNETTVVFQAAPRETTAD